jgi:hypothetical protein
MDVVFAKSKHSNKIAGRHLKILNRQNAPGVDYFGHDGRVYNSSIAGQFAVWGNWHRNQHITVSRFNSVQ